MNRDAKIAIFNNWCSIKDCANCTVWPLVGELNPEYPHCNGSMWNDAMLDAAMEAIAKDIAGKPTDHIVEANKMGNSVDCGTQSTVSKVESVDHPAHYQGQHECIDVMLAMFGRQAVMDFCRCNIFKYRFRADAKGGDEDIKKAEWYEDKLMEMMKN